MSALPPDTSRCGVPWLRVPRGRGAWELQGTFPADYNLYVGGAAQLERSGKDRKTLEGEHKAEASQETKLDNLDEDTVAVVPPLLETDMFIDFNLHTTAEPCWVPARITMTAT